MYSMPQQAVTNGYWNSEYFRPQFTAARTVGVKNPSWSVSSWSAMPCGTR